MSGSVAGFPERLCGMVDGERRAWVMLPEWRARRPMQPGRGRDAGDELHMFRVAEPGHDSYPERELLAVYGPSAAGPPMVPTGRVWLRFEDGVNVETQRGGIERAGYVIEEIIAYAPNAAWLKWATGDMCEALAHLPALLSLPHLRTLEPQLIARRALRDDAV